MITVYITKCNLSRGFLKIGWTNFFCRRIVRETNFENLLKLGKLILFLGGLGAVLRFFGVKFG